MARKKQQKSEAKTSRYSNRRIPRSRKTDSGFKNIRTEGAILPVEILVAIASGDPRINGLRPDDFYLPPGERLNEKITEIWSKLKRCWELFKQKRDDLPESDYGTTLTRQAWLLPLFRLLDYGNLGYYHESPVINDKVYAISHYAQEPVALHLVSFRQDLDSRDTENRAGARISPHSLVQEFLNQSNAHLWGFVTNGLKFRILRDNASLVRAAFLEFDLEAIMESDSYGDFYLFYLLVHQSRVETQHKDLEFEDESSDDEEEKAVEQFVDTDCWLEVWHHTAKEDGVRALDTLRGGVTQAINKLGAGFLSHRENVELRQKLHNGTLDRQEYYRQILRLVYRMIFLLIAEDRELLFGPKTLPETKELYRKYYSISRLRSLARRQRGSRHYDLWEQLKKTFGWFAAGQPLLGIPAFGSTLFHREFTAALNDVKITNTDLLAAIRSLTWTSMNNLLQPINYRNIGTEELGSVYESLLEMHPVIQGNYFNLDVTSGNERKTSGSFYTPPALVDSLVDTALVPVMEEAVRKGKTTEEKENALLGLKVCDPACGSGHFLIGAAHRMGKRLAQIRSGDEEPGFYVLQTAVRDVIAHCIYGVDINPMAVELCKVSLWIESMAPGKALMFLDHRIRCGNSLLGTTRELVEAGIPDEAFKPVEGDDKAYCQRFKKLNKEERYGQKQFDFDESETMQEAILALDQKVRSLDCLPNETADDYDHKENAHKQYLDSPEYRAEKFKADLWCGAFVWKKTGNFDFPITQRILNRAKREDQHFLLPWMRDELMRLVDEYQFFHWEIEFADIFPRDGVGGFDVIIGNPPWETLEIKEIEYFALTNSEISNAKTTEKRAYLISQLESMDPALYAQYTTDKRFRDGVRQIIRETKKYPLCARKKINTYSIFAELNRQLISSTGRAGCIVQSGIATDDTTKFFFQDVMKSNSLVSLYDFENRKKIFPAVHSSMKFSLLTISGIERPSVIGADMSFFNLTANDLEDEERHFHLSLEDVAMINPNTRTCPTFRTVKDAELTKAIYRRVPILLQETHENKEEKNPWNVHFTQGLFNMSSKSYLFRERDVLEGQGYRLEGNFFVKPGTEKYWPLYEGKMIHHYNHRFGDYNDRPLGSNSKKLPNIPIERLQNPDYVIMPRYWVPQAEVMKRITHGTEYLMGWRDITNTTNERTVIASMIPLSAVGHTMPLIYFNHSDPLFVPFYAGMGAFVFDYFSRQKIGGTHLTYLYFKQLPFLSESIYKTNCSFLNIKKSYEEFIKPKVLELIYTSNDMRPFAESLGDSGNPFRWNETRRFLLRCELDALYFGLYLGFGDWSDAKEYEETPEQLAELKKYFPTPLDALDHIMGTFPIVQRKDLADPERLRIMREICPEVSEANANALYPSHAVIRKMYQEMTAAIRSGTEYKTHLSPPPADDSLRHDYVSNITVTNQNQKDISILEYDIYWTRLVIKLWGKPIDWETLNNTLVFALNPEFMMSFTDVLTKNASNLTKGKKRSKFIKGLDEILKILSLTCINISSMEGILFYTYVINDNELTYNEDDIYTVNESIKLVKMIRKNNIFSQQLDEFVQELQSEELSF